jgi:hypothetical protein
MKDKLTELKFDLKTFDFDTMLNYQLFQKFEVNLIT